MVKKVRFDVDPVRSKSRPLSDHERRMVLDLEEHCQTCLACLAHLHDCLGNAMCLSGRSRWHDIAALFDHRDGRIAERRNSQRSIEYVEIPERYKSTNRLLQIETWCRNRPRLRDEHRPSIGLDKKSRRPSSVTHSRAYTHSVSMCSSQYYHSSNGFCKSWHMENLSHRGRHHDRFRQKATSSGFRETRMNEQEYSEHVTSAFHELRLS